MHVDCSYSASPPKEKKREGGRGGERREREKDVGGGVRWLTITTFNPLRPTRGYIRAHFK